jgi:hypothetical protein
MTKLTRFFGTCLLVVSLFSVALGGDTLTPPVAPPPPAECVSDCPGTEASAPQQSGSDLGGDIVTAVDMLLAAIF